MALCAPLAAAELRYVANENHARWQSEGSRLHCELSHTIPLYGRAVFTRRAGEALRFRLEPHQGPRQSGVARLVSSAPAWHHSMQSRDLGEVDYRPDGAPLRLSGAMARRLLLELEGGMYPTFSYQDWADGRDRVEVALAAVNVRSALGRFRTCLDGQLDFDLDDVRVSRIQFGFDSSELSGQARRRLDRVAEYLLADPSIRKVSLEGLTDKTGFRRYNEALAKRRAEAVRDYLTEQGVSSELFAITAYGERQSIASNRTTQGRATNRAVIVSLMQ
ncbi:MAG: flagellar protein MotY [Pseudomonadota bacterium]